MTKKKYALGYLGAIVLAFVTALICVLLEAEEGGGGPALSVRYFSDGFFLSAVLLLGCGTLTWIAEAGNFYGIQYLGYTLLRLFSPRKARFDDRKDYFTYCTEKQAKQTEKGKSAAKRIMLRVGLGCLILSGVLAFVFYRLP